MPFMPLTATGVVVKKTTETSSPELRGTCAKYVLPHVAVTAKHNVPEGPEAYAVSIPSTKEFWSVEQIVRDPEADLAVVVGAPYDAMFPNQVYTGVHAGLIDGGDFAAYGYPFEGEGAVGRLFKGHFQRYMGYKDTFRNSYFAGELSIPAPRGLSGGPVSYAHTLDQLAAVVTANIDSYLVEDAYEEEVDKDHVRRGEIRRIVAYGIAVMLPPKANWLNEIVDSARS
jgi:hypothetical protein